MRSDEHIDPGVRKILSTPGRRIGQPLMRVRTVSGVTVAELRGEIDIHAVQSLQPRLDVLTARDEPALALDLCRIDFLDCSGLALLVRSRRRAAERGGSWALACDHPLTLRILRITSLLSALGPAPTLEQALESFSRAERTVSTAE
ncbi:STAS domain-containing protein [Streptomyces sp. NPDC020719]|uniref:STAS domain-containing protein n=1 Tax=unclassified Streptomyces TaxID=2593676 RepID=UPI0033EA78FD